MHDQPIVPADAIREQFRSLGGTPAVSLADQLVNREDRALGAVCPAAPFPR